MSEEPINKRQKMMTTEPVEYVCAIDIERIGKEFDYGVLAVGVCFGTADGRMLHKWAFCGRVPDKEKFEKRCWDEFWVNYPEQLKLIDESATENHISALHARFLWLQKQYGPFGRKHRKTVSFRWCSDNGPYDFGMVNLEFSKLGLPTTCAEMFDDYVPTDDPTEQEAKLTQKQQALIALCITVPHDHCPWNDAAQHYQRLCGVKLVHDCTTVLVLKDADLAETDPEKRLLKGGDEVISIDMKKFEAARARFTDIPVEKTN
jgi:hypothetical protein